MEDAKNESNDDIPTVLAPQQQIDELIWSFTKARLVYAAAKLGIPDMLSTGPYSASAITRSLKTDADITYRLMRGLAWCGLLDHGDDDEFSLTPIGRCLCSDVDGSMYDNAISMGEVDWPVWNHLVDVMKAGPPGFPRAFGMNLFEYFTRNEAAGRRFDGQMEQFSATVSGEIVENCDFSGYRTFVDVGGGKAQLATAILEANPHLHGTVFDRPSVIERTSSHLATLDLGARCEAVAGDFFDSVPHGREVYILKWILHDWPDDRCVRILENCRRQIADDGLLVVVDHLIPERVTTSTRAVMWDLHMLLMLDGRERTELQFRELFQRAGFELTRTRLMESGMSVIEASPV